MSDGEEVEEREEPATGVELPPAFEEVEPRPEEAENLLGRLLYKGVLPRYAFPTDVASFYVFDVNRSRPDWPVFQFAPSQGLAIALTQYAPGKEVWIANQRYVAGAIYSRSPNERSNAWHRRRLYFECQRCRYAMTETLDRAEKGERRDCPGCGTVDSLGPARYWLRPPGFAHPVFVTPGTTPEDQPARSYATRAKLYAPTPGPEVGRWRHLTKRLRTHHMREHLLVTNTGPRQEGYSYCTLCGLIEPTASSRGRVLGPHQTPYPARANAQCPGNRSSSGICLGTDYITDVLLVSIRVEPPTSLAPGLPATEVALRTLSDALAEAACAVLDVEAGEIAGEYRAATTPEGVRGLEAEVFLYDTLSGGAGFARQAGDAGERLFREALRLLTQCDCDYSCYKCLRSFKNRFDHNRLDRFLGRDLLRLVLDGLEPELSPGRYADGADLLAADIQRQGGRQLTVERDARVTIEGVGTVTAPICIRAPDGDLIIAVTHPLAPAHAPDPLLSEVAELQANVPVLLQSELRIRRNLPAVTRSVLDVIGEVAR